MTKYNVGLMYSSECSTLHLFGNLKEKNKVGLCHEKITENLNINGETFLQLIELILFNRTCQQELNTQTEEGFYFKSSFTEESNIKMSTF